MAGDWIKVEVTTPDKPEVVRLATLLGIDQDAVTGKLVRIWVWANQNSINGNDVPVTKAFLDRLTACPGFSDALAEVGWLIVRSCGITLPRFDRHNGQTAKARAQTNRRVAEHRERNGEVTPPPLQKPLPEKKRVEKSKAIPPTPQAGFVGGEEVVEGIWRIYPRKTGKRADALQAIRVALTKIDADTLRAAVTKYTRTPGLDREDGRWIPLAVNWFNDEAWKDYLPKPPAPVVNLPRPSRALEYLRNNVLHEKAPLSANQRAYAAVEIGRLTPEDDKFITDTERAVIDALKKTPA